jgi:hypothetical protein
MNFWSVKSELPYWERQSETHWNSLFHENSNLKVIMHYWKSIRDSWNWQGLEGFRDDEILLLNSTYPFGQSFDL